MTPPQQMDPAWRYWKARALAVRGQGAEARALLEVLAHNVSFYGLLAAEESGIVADFQSEPVLPTPSELTDLDGLPSVQRMLKFYDLELRSEALREWIWTIRNFDDRQRLIAAQYALSKGLFDRAINTADTTVARHDFALRIMAPYRTTLSEAAQQTGLDEALVFGLVRQESRFRADAVSSAGAVGLMQLMPPTAKWVAKQIFGKADYRPSQISDVATNAMFGSYYFKYWLDRFENLSLLAIAGYNAGPGRAQAWRSARQIEGAIYAETIPFNETRDYVKKVLANAVLYARQFGTGRFRRSSSAWHSFRRAAASSTRLPPSARRRPKSEARQDRGPGRHRVRRPSCRECAGEPGSRSHRAGRREHAKPLFLLPRVQVPEVDVRDAAALAAAIRGADAVIDLIGVLHESPREFHQNGVEILKRRSRRAGRTGSGG